MSTFLMIEAEMQRDHWRARADRLEKALKLAAQALREEAKNLSPTNGTHPAPWMRKLASALTAAASADTRPQGGDATEIAAPFTSGAVAESETPQ